MVAISVLVFSVAVLVGWDRIGFVVVEVVGTLGVSGAFGVLGDALVIFSFDL